MDLFLFDVPFDGFSTTKLSSSVLEVSEDLLSIKESFSSVFIVRFDDSLMYFYL